MKTNARLIIMIFIFSALWSCKKKNNPPFEKIIFHTDMCFGRCPVYHLALDKNKKIHLWASLVFKDSHWNKDTSKMGYYEGYASDTSFQKLSKIINNIRIDTIKYKPIACCDGAVKTIITYRDGNRIYIRSMVLPKKLRPLTDALQEICETKTLKRVYKKFEIENKNHLDKRNANSPIEIDNGTIQ